MIAGLEQARSLEQFEKFLVPLAEWLERIRDPDLLASFRAWVTLVLAPRVGSAEQTLELDVRRKEEAKMTTLKDDYSDRTSAEVERGTGSALA